MIGTQFAAACGVWLPSRAKGAALRIGSYRIWMQFDLPDGLCPGRGIRTAQCLLANIWIVDCRDMSLPDIYLNEVAPGSRRQGEPCKISLFHGQIILLLERGIVSIVFAEDAVHIDATP